MNEINEVEKKIVNVNNLIYEEEKNNFLNKLNIL